MTLAVTRLITLAVAAVTIAPTTVSATAYTELHSPYTLTHALLREVVEKMGQAADDYLKYPTGRRVTKEDEDERRIPVDYEALLDPQEAMIRDQEYLQHSSLWGHQYMAGGAGEGKQRLKPDGSMKNIHEVKTDSVLPAYCDPPNPCPLGYDGDDGCLENFVNTAAFSREYQAAQDCMCDTEHMFGCPSSSRHDEINALAQSIQNEGLTDHTLNRIMEDLQIDDQHKSLVAKKHHNSQVHNKYLRELRAETQKLAIKAAASRDVANPYLKGEKLPIVAKKGSHVLM